MTRYQVNPAFVYQQGTKLPITFATENIYNTNDTNFSIVVRDFSNEVSFGSFVHNITERYT